MLSPSPIAHRNGQTDYCAAIFERSHHRFFVGGYSIESSFPMKGKKKAEPPATGFTIRGAGAGETRHGTLADGRPYQVVMLEEPHQVVITFTFSSRGIETMPATLMDDMLRPQLEEYHIPLAHRRCYGGRCIIINEDGESKWTVTYMHTDHLLHD